MVRKPRSNKKTAPRQESAPRWRGLAGWAAVSLAFFAAGVAWVLHDLPRPPVPGKTPGAAEHLAPPADTRTSAKTAPVPPAAPLSAPAVSAPRIHWPEPAPASPVTGFPRPVASLAEAQIELARRCFSCGPVDGRAGAQTAAALRAFQESEGLTRTGALDAATRARLVLQTAPLTTRVVMASDLQRLQPLSPTWLGKSQQTALEHETVLELVAEESHAHPACIRELNPGVTWAAVPPGTVLTVPAVSRVAPKTKAAGVVISLSQKTLQARDERGRLLAHFPVSIARSKEKRPEGELRVVNLAPDPNYTFNPAVFPESAEARELGRKLILPPGPNNPVGVAWVGLSLPGYGIHGTPEPEKVGRTESHGCFRLANWDAQTLVNLVWVGMPVFVEN